MCFLGNLQSDSSSEQVIPVGMIPIFPDSQCSVSASLPLPPLPWSRVAEAGLVEVLLEEWLLRPLQTLATIRPMAELYRLKRNIMDSPFRCKSNIS